MKTLHISAGGKGSRIAEVTSKMGPDMPKHLLPIPTIGKTIIGEIILNAKADFESTKVWVSSQNHDEMVAALNGLAEIAVDHHMTGPLGPMIRAAVSTRNRTHACAGDFFCDFSWEKFEEYHNQNRLPISILVANSVPTIGGARFVTSGHLVQSWERVSATTQSDQINIGCYIIDPTDDVVRILNGLRKHKEDPFFDEFIARGKVSGYNPGKLGYNINIADVYDSLTKSLETK